jgi:predicted secreted protein
MADATYYHGRETAFELGDGTVSPTFTDISQFLEDASPTLSASTVDVTPFGTGAWAHKLAGVKSGSFALAGFVDNDVNGATALLQALFESGDRTTFRYYPTGKVDGRRFMEGTGIVSSFSPKSTSTAAVTFASEVLIDGEPTWSTYTAPTGP